MPGVKAPDGAIPSIRQAVPGVTAPGAMLSGKLCWARKVQSACRSTQQQAFTLVPVAASRTHPGHAGSDVAVMLVARAGHVRLLGERCTAASTKLPETTKALGAKAQAGPLPVERPTTPRQTTKDC